MPEFLLSSTVIGIIITGAYSLIQFQKVNSLKYITKERKKWREEIRNIMKEIEVCEEKNTSGILVQLKARINAYGLYSEMDYAKDAHIWKLIAVMEKQEAARNKNEYYWEEPDGKQEENDENKDLLLKFLSLLLKSDWDRSKYEIEGNKQLLLNNLLNIAAIVLCTLMLSTTPKTDLAISKKIWILLVNVLLLVWVKYGPIVLRKILTVMQRQSVEAVKICSKYVIDFIFKLLTKPEQKERKKQKNNKTKLIYLIKPVCLFIPVIVIFGVNRYGTLINGNFDITYLLFILIVILLVPSSWACYNDEIDSFRRRQSYFFTIDKLLSENPKFEKAKLNTFPEK